MDVQTDAVQPEPVRSPANVRDRGSAVRETVRRALLRTALGEEYAYDVMPVLAPDGTGRIEAGYVVYVSAPLPLLDGSRCSVASRPFEFDAGTELIEKVTFACVEQLRRARSEALRVP